MRSLFARVTLAALVINSLVVVAVSAAIGTGSPVDAAPTGFTAVNPARLLDTRPGGTTIDNQHVATGALQPGTTLELNILGRGTIPTTGVAAIAINITATNTSTPTGTPTYITAYPTGQPRPTASNLNPTPDHPTANTTQLPLGTNNTITLYNHTGTTDLIVDIIGWYPTTTPGFTAVNPARLLDTRATGTTIDNQHVATGALQPGTTLELNIVGRGTIPTTGVAAIAINITATNTSTPTSTPTGTPTSTPTYITAYPTGQPRPTASNLNPTPDHPTANTTQLPLGTNNTITLYNHTGTTDLIVDIIGWYPTASTGGPGTPLPPLPAGVHPRIYLPGAETRLSGLLGTSAPTATRFKSYVDSRLGSSFESLEQSDFRMWQFALLGQLTDDTAYCTRAVAGIERFVAGEEARISTYVSGDPSTGPVVGYDSYLDIGPLVGAVMMVYDWCFAQVSESQRTRWLTFADHAVWNVWHPDDANWGGRPAPWSGWSIDNPSNNYYYSFLRATMLLGLGAEGELPSAAGWRTFFRTTKIQNQLVPTFEADLAGGGSREGTGYGTAMMRLWEIYDLWESSTGEDISALTGHTRASLVQQMHSIVPTRNALSLNGDHSRDSTATLFDYHRHYAQSLAHLLTGDPLAGRAKSLFNASSVPRMQNGFMVVYDFLYDTSTIPDQPVAALNTAYYGSGVGQLFARADWSNDATWMNVTAGPYTESHAHRDQGSFLLYKRGWMAVDPNYFSHSGIRQEEELHNLVRIVDSSGSTVTQREGTASTVQALRQGADYLHFAADSTAVYTANAGAPVQRVQREVVYLEPDVAVVFDRVTTSPGTTQRWQLNTPTLPTIAGTRATVTSGSTTMQVDRVVAPATSTSIFDWTTDGDMSGGHRLDTVASGGANTFLHVLSFDGATTSVVRSDAAGRQGVTISFADGRRSTVRFSPTGVDGTLEIVAPGGAVTTSVALMPVVSNLGELTQ